VLSLHRWTLAFSFVRLSGIMDGKLRGGLEPNPEGLRIATRTLLMDRANAAEVPLNRHA
jgi:hypothetical protein